MIDLKIDYIEDWSTGSCVNDEHGANDCTTDRYQLCAQNLASTTDAWNFIHCNFQYQSCLSTNTSPGGQYPNCYLDGVLEGCAAYLSKSGVDYAALKSCATNTTSAAWAKASGNVTAVVASSHPLWVQVDGAAVTDDSAGTTAWATSVLTAICKAAKAKGVTAPAACDSASSSFM